MSKEAKKPVGNIDLSLDFHLERIHIDGFKALVDTDVYIGDRNISLLIGPNGAGKTSLLQAIGFIRYFVEGKPRLFFEHHGWDPDMLVSHVAEKRLPSFSVVFVLSSGILDVIWSFIWSASLNKNTRESICVVNRATGAPFMAMNLEDGCLEFPGWNNEMLGIYPEGSALSFIKLDNHPDRHARQVLEDLRSWAEGIVSLELLSPDSMRHRNARGKVNDIGIRGEQLGAFLAGLPADAKQRIVERLTAFYPQLTGLTTTAKRAGWIDLKIAESYRGRALAVGAQHVSDGFLRLLALAALPEFPKTTSLVLLDEVENGIDPLILPDYLDMISRQSSTQIMMTTHSPLLVNRFPPEVIHFIARSEGGASISARLVDIPEFETELEYRGAGEIWAHSSLGRMSELVRAAHERAKANPATEVSE